MMSERDLFKELMQGVKEMGVQRGVSNLDKTNRVIKIWRRIEELEYKLACKDMMSNEADEARLELRILMTLMKFVGVEEKNEK